MLLSAVLFLSAFLPQAVLLPPVVFVYKERNPTATFSEPIVFAVNAPSPTAVLLLPEEVDAELKSTDAVQRTGVQLGVIAQELQEVCSDCIKEETTGVLRVDSDNVFWHMVNAIKDLKALNDTQAATITALTARIVALENK